MVRTLSQEATYQDYLVELEERGIERKCPCCRCGAMTTVKALEEDEHWAFGATCPACDAVIEAMLKDLEEAKHD